MKRILLDTNVYTKFLAGDEKVLDTLAKAQTIYISVIVMGELYVGFKGGTKESENKRLLERFLHKSTVQTLHVTEETAQVFAEIKVKLQKKGKPIPINDVWIAAQTIETGSVLCSYDAHFLSIAQVRLWDLLR